MVAESIQSISRNEANRRIKRAYLRTSRVLLELMPVQVLGTALYRWNGLPVLWKLPNLVVKERVILREGNLEQHRKRYVVDGSK